MGLQEEIQQRISDRLTNEANKLEGGFAQDIIGSISYEFANIIETELDNIINRAFVSTATGEDLDQLGNDYGLPRREETQAIVYLEITGDEFSTINSNVKAVYNNLVFTVQEFKKINSSGVALVKAKCDTPGTIGNVPANTITQFLTDYTGLRTVTNPESAYDGFDREDDEVYRQRILDYLREDATNANKLQYEKWTREVAGVQKAVIKNAKEMNVEGTVGVYISAIDSTVSEELIAEVKNHIEEVQPINATIVVDSLNYININISATLIIKDGFNEIDVKDEFILALKEYLPTVDNAVSYFRISELLFNCSGVEDVVEYTLNGDVDSIILEKTDYPTIGEVQIVAS